MVFAAALLLTLGQTPEIEVVVSDTVRKISWLPDGTRAKSYAPPRWLGEAWKDLGQLVELSKPGHRLVLVRVPYTVETPNFFFQFPNGGRIASVGKLPVWRPQRSWIAFFKVPMSAAQDEGLYEFGVAYGPWQTEGTKWPGSKRAEGAAFNARPVKSDSPEVWGYTINLPEAPRHLAWRVVPFGKSGNQWRSAGVLRIPRQSRKFLFTSAFPRDSVTRIEFQRRPITWTKFANFVLEGPL